MRIALQYILALGLLIGSIFLLSSDPIYLGNVVGKINVSNPYRIGNSGAYKYVDISFPYKDKEGLLQERSIDTVSKYYLINNKTGKLLSEGKVYGHTWYTVLLGLLGIFGSITIVIITSIICGCHNDWRNTFYHKISYDEFKNGHWKCEECGISHLCYYNHTKMLSDKRKVKIKQFFGY